MSYVPNTACKKKKILARGIQCCPNYFLSFCPTSFYIMRIHTYVTADRLYVNYRRYPITLQWNTFTQFGAVRSVDWIFIVGAPVWRWLGDYVTLGGAVTGWLCDIGQSGDGAIMWHWTERWQGDYVTLGGTFYSILFKTESNSSQLLPRFVTLLEI